MQRVKKVVALWTILSLALAFLPVSPGTEAAQLLYVRDTITDSKPDATATHSIQFTIQTNIPANGSIYITLPSGFNWNGASGSCPWGGTFSTTSEGVRCVALSATNAPATGTVTINNVVNASTEGSYLIYIETRDGSDNVLDTGETRIAIVSGVTVTAHVPALLTFEVRGVDAGTAVESGTTNVTSTTTTIDFGTVDVNTQYLAAQKLVVSTNANYGFSVKVWQNQNLTNAMGNDIDRFRDGTSTLEAWASPSTTPGAEWTYGHFGLRSDDSDVELNFGTNLWTGFSDDGPNYQVEVLRSDRPTAGEGDDQGYGWDYVEYALEISALQEAGDYSNILTYICTPTY